MKHTLIPLLAAIYLTACSTTTPAPMTAALPSPTIALTQTPVPTLTLTPTIAPAETTVTAGSEAGISYEAPAEGWGQNILVGLDAHPEAKVWYDTADGTQWIEFKGNEDITDEQLKAELKKICGHRSFVITKDGSYLTLDVRYTGDIKAGFKSDGGVELHTNANTMKDLDAEEYQTVNIKFLLDPNSPATEYTYRNLGLSKLERFDMETILQKFATGSDNTVAIIIDPGIVDQTSAYYQAYGGQYDEAYLTRLNKWINSGFTDQETEILVSGVMKDKDY